MRVIAVLAAVLLLSGCTWVRQELSPPPTLPAAPAPPTPKPAEPRPHRPVQHVERPAPPPAQTVNAAPTPAPPVDYNARCHAMADNRADDAKQLGASGADLAKVQQDTYRDCMAQSVKPSQ